MLLIVYSSLYLSAAMGDSDDEPVVNLTGFLFGNIDESGNLESDVFDTTEQKQLASLGR